VSATPSGAARRPWSSTRSLWQENTQLDDVPVLALDDGVLRPWTGRWKRISSGSDERRGDNDVREPGCSSRPLVNTRSRSRRRTKRYQTELLRQREYGLKCEDAGQSVVRAFRDTEDVRGSDPLAPTSRPQLNLPFGLSARPPAAAVGLEENLSVLTQIDRVRDPRRQLLALDGDSLGLARPMFPLGIVTSDRGSKGRASPPC
jgi:hypothetical protein